MPQDGHQLIAGRRSVGSAGTAPVVNPADGRLLVEVDLAGDTDVDAAVAAAVAAFPGWSRTTPAERSAALLRLAGVLADRADLLASTETRQTGKPLRFAADFDVAGTIDNVAYFAGAARTLEGRATGEYSPEHTSSVRREAIGVVGAVCPWNYPLQMAAWKLLPAIAAGNTLVLKPSELTPLTALLLGEACEEAGIPTGVVNVVTGTGLGAGERLVAHPQVAMVSFTGSSEVGRRVAALASTAPGGPRRLHLELGGKAPFLVYDDADLEATVHGAVAGALVNSGQDCTAATRAYVQRPLYDAFVSAVADLMRGVRLGDPMDSDTDLGPLVSHRQRERVSGFVDRAVSAGAKVVCGGSAPGGSLTAGAYYEPTLVTDAEQQSEIVQGEVFGPVLVVLPFDRDDEGLRLANDSPYGLAASVWTRDVYRSQRASVELRAGCVWVNDHIPIVSEMPHGGYGASGYGKDLSAYALEEYTSIKHVMSDRTAVARKPWHRTIFAERGA